MSSACHTFRAALVEALTTGADGATRSLGWHEHLLGCGSCRELLAAEEALDELLRSLPEPHLPRDLARRVLERLGTERHGDALERLLAEDAAPIVPDGLPGRVLAGLRAERRAAGPRPVLDVSRLDDARLDAWLDRVTAPVPEGLSARVLQGLAAERALVPAARGRRLRLVGRLVGLAAALLLVLGLVRLFGPASDPEGTHQARTPLTHEGTRAGFLEGGGTELASATGVDEEVEPELLAALDVLENWDWVTSDDLDLMLAELEAADWTLLEWDTAATEEAR